MLIFTVTFPQLAAVICKIDVSCITTQQIVYYPVDVPSSVSKSGLKSLSRLLSLAYASRLKTWALGRGVGIYTYPGGTPWISDKCAAALLLGGRGGALGGCGFGFGVGCLSRFGGGPPMPLRPQLVWGLCAVPFWQGRQLSVWCSQSIAACLSVAAFTFTCLGNPTPCFISSRTTAWCYLIRNCVSPIVARENPPWPCWPYSWLGACQTVLAVPDLLALP